MIRPGNLTVLHLGLSHRGLKVNVPQRWRLAGIRLAAGKVAQEGPLSDPAGMVIDRRVREGPINRETQRPPQPFEDLLVLSSEHVAQLYEVSPRDGVPAASLLGGHECCIVGHGRIASHAVVVLNPALGRQAVVIPTHRVEDLEAPHPFESSERIGLHVPKDRAHVQRPADGGRRRVDRVDLRALVAAVEPVGAVLFPALVPPGFQARQRRLLRDVVHRRRL